MSSFGQVLKAETVNAMLDDIVVLDLTQGYLRDRRDHLARRICLQILR